MNHENVTHSKKRLPVAGSVLIVMTIGTVLWVNAGDLNPPPGPIMPTNRIPLNDQAINLPFTISSSGSYFLTSNLKGLSGSAGIIIDADNVTLDLNGFSLVGVAGSLDGIRASGNRRNITVKNGMIHDWGGWGVSLLDFSNGAFESLFEGLQISNNGAGGARIGAHSVVVRCIARNNTGDGFEFNTGVVMRDCVAGENSANGFDHPGSENVSIRNCVARGNAGIGIRIGAVSMVQGCNVTRNNGGGISAGQDTVVKDCNVSFQPFVNFGIEADTGCHVLNNTCGNGGGKGIVLTAGAQRAKIDGNHCILNTGVGIDVAAGTNNLVVRNHSAANFGGDYAVGAGNFVGTLTNNPAAAGAWHNFDF